MTTSTPVTLSIILNESQLDAGFLIQTERNEKAFFKNTKQNDACEEYIRLVTV